jgi:hypothetical protein
MQVFDTDLSDDELAVAVTAAWTDVLKKAGTKVICPTGPGGGHVDVLLTDDQKEGQNGTVDPRSAGEVPTAEVGSIHIQKSGGRILHLP